MSQLDEIREIIKNIAISQAETNKQFKEFQKQSQIETDKLKESIKKVSSLVGASENNKAAMIESLFYNSIIKTMTLSNIHYDFINQNIRMKEGKKEVVEVDIILYNGTKIAIIEVKSKAHVKDLDTFDKIVKIYRKMNPHDKREILLYYASFCFYKEIEKVAVDKGISLLSVQGDTIENLSNSPISH